MSNLRDVILNELWEPFFNRDLLEQTYDKRLACNGNPIEPTWQVFYNFTDYPNWDICLLYVKQSLTASSYKSMTFRKP